MQVVIVGANSRTGRALIPALSEHQVTALVRQATGASPVRTVSDWTRAAEAEAVLGEAEVVYHLVGEIMGSRRALRAANVEATARVVRAVRPGTRIVFVSYPGADPQSDNPFLASKGQAEWLVHSVGPAVVFRVQAVLHDPTEPGPFEQAVTVPPGGRGQTLGDGRQPLRVVLETDLVRALVAAATGPSGTFDLCSDEPFTVDDVIRLINRRPDLPIRHTPPWLARGLSLVVPDLPPAFVDLYLRPPPTLDPARFRAAYGFSPAPARSVFAP